MSIPLDFWEAGTSYFWASDDFVHTSHSDILFNEYTVRKILYEILGSDFSCRVFESAYLGQIVLQHEEDIYIIK